MEADVNSQPAVGITSLSEEFSSNGLNLHGYLSIPEVNQSLWLPMLLVCQDFPHGRKDFSFVDKGLVELVAKHLGWSAFTFSYRGCGKSEGDFSFAGWQADINAAVDYLWEEHSEEVWIVGFGVGGTLGLAAAAKNLRVQGVAAASAFGNLKAWTEEPSKLVAKLVELKAKGWQEEAENGSKTQPALQQLLVDVKEIDAVEAAKTLSPRPLLVMHGQDDEIVSPLEARAIADAHAFADLRVLEGGDHNLRHDPRTLALLFSWLDRNPS